MSQQKLLDNQQQLKNYGRRSRKDQQGRDYICGCGKSYLSYPALYTHIKTKHDGQKPQGTFKVGVSANNRKNVGSTGAASGGTGGAAGHVGGAAADKQDIYEDMARMAYARQYGSHPQNIKPSPPAIPQQPPKLSLQILTPIEQLIKYQDLHILTQLDQTAQGITFADNRIQKQYAGLELYQKYHILLKQSQLLQKNQQDEQIIQSYIKLSNKSQLDTVLVTYLLGVGRYVSQYMMQYYQQFANMFRNCFYDHIEQIYQVCYKNNQQYWIKHRQRQLTRQRDNPQKCYQYSYPPSSSKSKSYNNNLLYTSSASSTGNNYISTFNNIVINVDQCKYCPLVCEFFVRVYVPVEAKLAGYGSGSGSGSGASTNSNDNYYVNMMELICTDFCGWMYRHKYTVVEVGLNKKYEVIKKDCVFRDKYMNTQGNGKDVESNVQVSWLAVNRADNAGGNGAYDQRSKRKQKKVGYAALGGKKRGPQTSGRKQKQQHQGHKNKSNTKQYDQQQNEEYNQQNQLQNQDQNDQESYKIGHQIVGHEHEPESGLRDRSGSIHRFIDGHHGDQHGGEEQGNHAHPHNGHHGNGHSNANGGSNGSAEEEQIQQYINPCYPGDKP